MKQLTKEQIDAGTALLEAGKPGEFEAYVRDRLTTPEDRENVDRLIKNVMMLFTHMPDPKRAVNLWERVAAEWKITESGDYLKAAQGILETGSRTLTPDEWRRTEQIFASIVAQEVVSNRGAMNSQLAYVYLATAVTYARLFDEAASVLELTTAAA